MIALIVDDAALNIRIYHSVLRGIPDLTFFDFTNSAEALAWAQSNSADLAIVDYNMPAPDGIEFIERFRAGPSGDYASVIMVTGEGDSSVRYRALAAGANDFLMKPIDPIELVARARNMLALADGRKRASEHSAWLAAEIERATANLRRRERETIMRLTRAAEFRDNETGMHIVRIGHFSALIGKAAGLGDDDVELLLLAAPMHDVGKVATPDHILLKPGKLDAAEWEIMQQHTIAGFEILKDSESDLLRYAAEIALGHHEKYDGTGYPHARKGEEIPLFARICAISDVYDALTSVRPYKTAWPADKSAQYVSERSGSQFDPTLVAAFELALPEMLETKRRYADVPVAAA
jgi:response regulator RpfG family c-di-GMP phosphodiesterase